MIEENLNVAAGPGRRRHQTSDAARETLCELGIEDLAPLLPSRLSTGQRRLAALARALVMRPLVLLMDEPAAGLFQAERDTLSRGIVRLSSRGMAVVLVDHDVDLVVRL